MKYSTLLLIAILYSIYIYAEILHIKSKVKMAAGDIDTVLNNTYNILILYPAVLITAYFNALSPRKK